MSEDLILVDKQEHIGTITLNRPMQRNALSPEMLDQLADTFDALDGDPEVRVVVLRGAGEKAFSAGYDIGRISTERAAASAQGRNEETPSDANASPLPRALESVMRYRYPVIAMIYGYAMGGGCDLAVTCDLRFAADSARLGMTPAKLGVMYSYQGIQRFIDLVGVGATKEIFFVGGAMDALRAGEIGLVNRVVPAADLVSTTYAVAREIADNAPLTVSGTKATIAKLTGFRRLSVQDEAEVEALVAKCFASEDLKEGQRAFGEKRKPVFRGR